jgi:amino acid permease
VSPSDDFEFYDREQLLRGELPPSRRADTLLFAIENRTAYLSAESRKSTALYLTAKTAEGREQAFFESMASGRTLLLQPKIQDIERYVPHWLPLVSEADVRLRAALAHALSKKYRLTFRAIPGIRAALGLDESAVKQAYQRLYKSDLTSIYVPKIGLSGKLRWLLARLACSLEGLPPFWVAFVLTLPVGPGLLALPIAVAGIGALPGVVLLLLFGIINILTVASLAETVARSGTTRFGIGYLGQLVAEYLGNAGSVLLTILLAVNNFLVLIAFYIGIAGTLEEAVHLPAELWILILFAVGIYFLTRKSLNTTVASTVLINFINVALIIVIPLFALPHVRPANLMYMKVPFLAGERFDPSLLQLIFGVMLSNYFSHLLVANYGRVIIRRDSSARSWIWGCIAAIALMMLISCLWVLTFNGALPHGALSSETGTAVAALAREVGPVVNWLGVVFVILSLGMACIHISLGLLFLVEERLPVLSEKPVSKKLRFVAAISPVLGVFLISEWLAFSNSGSFAKLLSLVGVIALPLLGGIFPVLLLSATRRKGDFVPGLVLRFLGNPILMGALYVLFLGSIFVYGIFVWDGIVERIFSILLGLTILIITVVMLKGKIFGSRVVLELREDLSPAGKSLFSVTARGRVLETEVLLAFENRKQRVRSSTGEIADFSLLRSVRFDLPRVDAGELKVWVHRITPEWISVALPSKLKLLCGSEETQVVLDNKEGQALFTLKEQTCSLEIYLPEQVESV